MYNNQSTLCMILGIGLAIAVLMGCGAKGQPAEFEQTAGEMKEGPGVLTGDEGAVVVYDSKRGGAFPQFKGQISEADSKDASEKAAKDASAASDTSAASTQVAAGQTSTGAQVSPEAAREFQEFQEWKKEQQAFREFQEWKKTAQGAAEYKEFLEWKEWKSYQEWKKQQGQ
ncbi:MAG: hypothetical protein PVI49_07945 [Desulfobacterales bacterium]|jgi:uncharacterized protein YjbJ (UPF0337 family)